MKIDVNAPKIYAAYDKIEQRLAAVTTPEEADILMGELLAFVSSTEILWLDLHQKISKKYAELSSSAEGAK